MKDGEGRDGLARTTLAHQAQNGVLFEFEGDPINSLNDTVFGWEEGVQVVDLKQCVGLETL